jgi:hypothetical protein
MGYQFEGLFPIREVQQHLHFGAKTTLQVGVLRKCIFVGFSLA